MADIICDTSSLQYFHQLSLIQLLDELADEVIVPQAVVGELEVGATAGVNVPAPGEIAWMKIQRPASVAVLPLVSGLGPGETEVLALGLEMPGTIVVLDDMLARRTAQSLKLPMTGTLGLLIDAKSKQFIPAIRPVLDQLQKLRFYISASTRTMILGKAGELE
ncbi:MAG: DUF3368 domain-containing protein [Rhodothermales bacterium]